MMHDIYTESGRAGGKEGKERGGDVFVKCIANGNSEQNSHSPSTKQTNVKYFHALVICDGDATARQVHS